MERSITSIDKTLRGLPVIGQRLGACFGNGQDTNRLWHQILIIYRAQSGNLYLATIIPLIEMWSARFRNT